MSQMPINMPDFFASDQSWLMREGQENSKLWGNIPFVLVGQLDEEMDWEGNLVTIKCARVFFSSDWLIINNLLETSPSRYLRLMTTPVLFSLFSFSLDCNNNSNDDYTDDDDVIVVHSPSLRKFCVCMSWLEGKEMYYGREGRVTLLWKRKWKRREREWYRSYEQERVRRGSNGRSWNQWVDVRRVLKAGFNLISMPSHYHLSFFLPLLLFSSSIYFSYLFLSMNPWVRLCSFPLSKRLERREKGV